jgi:hypothetical protein
MICVPQSHTTSAFDLSLVRPYFLAAHLSLTLYAVGGEQEKKREKRRYGSPRITILFLRIPHYYHILATAMSKPLMSTVLATSQNE